MKLVIANWKANPETTQEAKEIFDKITEGVKEIKDIEIAICPPFPLIPVLLVKKTGIKIGAQDCSPKRGGAYTGEVSPFLLKEMGCQYVILGHSERRQNQNETDEMVSKKMRAAVDAGLKPILCVGETEQENKEGKTEAVLGKQLKDGLAEFEGDFQDIIIAYEPVWAIGTDNACNGVPAENACAFIKGIAGNAPVIYGGSVKSENAAECFAGEVFSGLLVGGASLKPDEFIKIVENIR